MNRGLKPTRGEVRINSFPVAGVSPMNRGLKHQRTVCSMRCAQELQEFPR